MEKDNYIKNNKFYRGLIAILIVYTVIHIIARPVFGDDVLFKKMILKDYNFNIIKCIYDRYFIHSSRFILDVIMLSLPALPVIIWRVTDVLVICIMYTVFCKLINDSDMYVLLALLLCMYPFNNMFSAGWIATTTIYIWPFTALLLAVYIIRKKDINITNTLLYFLLIIYATNNECLAVIYLIWSVYNIIIYLKSKKEVVILYGFSAFISILEIINTLICPGNSVRIIKATKKWMPQFAEMSIFSRVKICIISTIQHFTSVPCFIFVAFSLVLFIYSIKQDILAKIVSMLQLIIALSISCYYAIISLKARDFGYKLPNIDKTTTFEYLLLFLAVLYLISVILNIIFIISDTYKRIELILIYLLGLIARFVLIQSPTMLSSGTRIYFLFYMAMIWVIAQIIMSNKKILSDNKRLIYIYCFVGAIFNIITCFAMQKSFL